MRTALLALLFSAAALAQSDLPGPVTVLRQYDGSAVSPLNLEALDEYFVGLAAPDSVDPIVISAATAANPTVLTLVGGVPPTLVVGSVITISGAAGAGCAGLNANQTITAVGASTVTVSFDATGCTYTASSASFKASVYYRMPGAGGVSGKCWGYASDYVIGWVSCGGSGANQYLSNLLSPTAVNQDLNPGTDNTYKIGDTAVSKRWYQVAANRFDGTCALCDWSTNYVTTRKLDLYDYYGLGGGFWDLSSVISGGAASYFRLRDNAGVEAVTFTRQSFGVTVNTATLDMHWVPSTDITYDLGDGGTPKRWRTLYVKDIVLSGTCTGCSSGSLPVLDTTIITQNSSDTTKQFRFSNSGIPTGTTIVGTLPGASFTFAGINLAQTWTATQTMRDINPSADDTYKLGDTSISKRWYQVAANRFEGICSGCTTSTNYAKTRKLEVYDQTGGSAFWYQFANVPAAGTASAYYLVDNAGTQVATFQTSDVSGTARKFYWKGSIIPGTTAAAEDNTWDIGASGNRYKKIWAYTTETDTVRSSGGVVTMTIDAPQVNVNGLVTATSYLNTPSSGTFLVVGTDASGGDLRLRTSGTNRWTVESSTGTLRPSTTPLDFGTSGVRVANMYAQTLDLSSTLNVSNAVTFGSTLNVTGAVTANAGINLTGTLLYSTGTNLQNSQLQFYGGGVARVLLWNGGALGAGGVRFFNTAGDRFWTLKASTATTGTSTDWVLPTADGSSDQCMKTDGSGNLGWKTCGSGTGTVTSIATSGPISGGTITTTGTISCPTCVTTAGGQSIAGTTTLSTASISTAISGAFNMSGNETVTGNWYNRTFSGGDANCSGVSDGWQGVRTDSGGASGKPQVEICIGGAMKYMALN